MLSKNNVQMINRKGQSQKQRFGLRKLSIGVASVLLGLTFLGASSVSADETAHQGQSEAQVELATVQPTTITNDESARQSSYNEVVSNGSSEAQPVSSEATTQGVADAAIQSPLVSDAQPATSIAPVSNAAPVTPVASVDAGINNSASNQPQADQVEVEIKFHDTDNNGQLVGDRFFVTGTIGNMITIDQSNALLPSGLEIASYNQDDLKVNGNPLQSINIFVKHQTEERNENKQIVQVIYGDYGSYQEKLNWQKLEFNRTVLYDLYTGEVIKVVSDWTTPVQKFEDYQVVAKDGYTPEISLVEGSKVNGDSTELIQIFVKMNQKQDQVKTEERTITRTINVHLPNGAVKTTVQTAVFTRQVTIKANGEVIYGDWDEIGIMLDDLKIGDIGEYKPSQSYIPRTVVNPDTESWVENIYYYTVEPETKDAHRVIHLHHPDGTVEQVKHTLTFTRDKYTNLTTGEVHHSEWTAPMFFEEFVVPEKEGHVADIEKIDRQEANSETGTIEHHVNYLAHKIDNEEHEVVRYINVTMPDGTVKTIKQVVKFTKSHTKHPLTDAVISSTDWAVADGSESSWAAFTPEAFEGYTPTIAQVDAETPAVDSADQTINISYTKDKVDQPVTPDPEDPNKPGNPDQPTDPEDPDKPGNPDQPTDPEDPDKPVNPDQPTDPEDPNKPVNPDQPTGPEDPTPGQPGDDQPSGGDTDNENPVTPPSGNNGDGGQGGGTVNTGTGSANFAGLAGTDTAQAAVVTTANAKAEADSDRKQSNQQQLPQTGDNSGQREVTLGSLALLLIASAQLLMGGWLHRKKQ